MEKKSRTTQTQSNSSRTGRRLQPYRPDRATVLIPLLALTVLLLIWWRIGGWYYKRLLADKRTQITAQSIPYGNALTSAIYRRFALLQGLKAFAEISASYTGMDAYFDAFASGLHSSTNGIRNLSIAPGGVQQYVYPLAGNENVPGHDLIHDKRFNVRADVQRAIRTGRIAISGPYELRQGGLGLVARQAIFQKGEFWGLVTMVLDMPPVLAEAGLELQSANLELALRDSSGQVFWGSEAIFDTEPVVYQVTLPEGDWDLAAMPQSGWKPSIHRSLLLFQIVSLVIVMLLTSVAYLLLHRQAYLTQMVQRRTQDLAQKLSERKQMEESLQKSEEKYRTLHESMMDAFVSVDMEGNIKEFNHAYLKMLGYSAEETITLTYVDLTPERWHEFEAKIVEEQILTRGFSEVYEKEYIKKDGTCFPVELRTFLVKDTSGAPKSMWAIVRDITERKRAEQMLKEYSVRLEDMVEERTKELREAQEQLVHQEKLTILGQLAGGVAHELRNPLGAIKNSVYFLNMVLEDPEPDVVESLQILEREVSNSQHIITSLLDFARPQELNLRQVDLSQLLQGVLAHQIMLAHIEVETMFAEGLPQIMADPSQLNIVFDNLIRNAVQAMPEDGRLSVNTSEVREESSEDRWIAVSIADTGIGIPNENIEKLFEPLFTTRAKGIGLGLALVKNLVEANGGSVAVKSEVDKGSTFTIRLPIGRNKLD